MQVANRTSRRDTTRRYVTPAMKSTTGNTRPSHTKPSNIPSISQSSPKKIVDISTEKSNEPLTLKKLVDRFHHDEPQSRPERDSINSDFWWLHDELQNTSRLNNDDDDEDRKSNLPDFIEIFPSTDIDQDLNKRASFLLNQTFSAHSSDTGHISSTGIGSTMATTTESTFHPPAITNFNHEQPARPIFTRIRDSKIPYRNDGTDEDILYQWRLRRRLEQAHHGEPITFPSKISNQSPARSPFPSMPIEIPTIIPPPITLPPSPKKDRQESSTTTTTTNTESIITPIPIRQYSEASTQTLQDACMQTSLTLSITPTVVPNEIDLYPTRDNNSSDRPPTRSKCEITRISSSSSPIKRHHHHHHHHQTFRPVVVTGQPTIRNHNTVQSSQESTLTQVTSIAFNENHRHQIRNNSSIDEYHEQIPDDNDIECLNDDILNMLQQKRDELLIQFREIEQCLAKINP